MTNHSPNPNSIGISKPIYFGINLYVCLIMKTQIKVKPPTLKPLNASTISNWVTDSGDIESPKKLNVNESQTFVYKHFYGNIKIVGWR